MTERLTESEEGVAKRVIYKARESALYRAHKPGVAFGQVYPDPKTKNSLVSSHAFGWELSVHVVMHTCGIEHWHAEAHRSVPKTKLSVRSLDGLGVLMGELTGSHEEVRRQLEAQATRSHRRPFRVIWFEGKVERLPAGIYDKIVEGIIKLGELEAWRLN